MRWVRGLGGAVLVLIGIVWIGQGVNLVPGSFMTGQPVYAVLGLILAALGVWLLWGLREGHGTTEG